MSVYDIDYLPIAGTNGNDTIIADLAAATDLFSWNAKLFPTGFEGSIWNRTVQAYGGDDLVLRDRMGDYKAEGLSVTGYLTGNVVINGGSGSDTVSYQSYGGGIEADLQHDGVGGWSHDGWVKQNGPAPAGETIFGRDLLSSVENLTGTNHADIIRGSDGANVLKGLGGHDQIWGENGDDTIYGNSGNDALDGGAGDDTIYGSSGNDVLSGGDDDDHLYGGSGNDELLGGQGDDYLSGGSGNDILEGGNGNDVLNGGHGNDVLEGGAGDDELNGGSGTDQARFHTGSDVLIVAGGGDFTAWSALGTDTMTGIENIITGWGDDAVHGSNGANFIDTKAGNDSLFGNGGNDTLFAGAGDDYVLGGTGDDLLFGAEGNDTLYGQDGEDTVVGGSGNDLISGGDGDDLLSGGAGADEFRWLVGDEGVDTIIDFEIGTDRISFQNGFLANQPAPDGSYVGEVIAWVTSDPDTASLHANTASGGWQQIALLEGVDANDVWDAIQNGDLFDPGGIVSLGGGPGGFAGDGLDVGQYGLQRDTGTDLGALSLDRYAETFAGDNLDIRQGCDMVDDFLIC